MAVEKLFDQRVSWASSVLIALGFQYIAGIIWQLFCRKTLIQYRTMSCTWMEEKRRKLREEIRT